MCWNCGNQWRGSRGMLMITALADVSPLNVLKYSFYMFGLIIATCVTIQFGLMDEKN